MKSVAGVACLAFLLVCCVSHTQGMPASNDNQPAPIIAADAGQGGANNAVDPTSCSGLCRERCENNPLNCEFVAGEIPVNCQNISTSCVNSCDPEICPCVDTCLKSPCPMKSCEGNCMDECFEKIQPGVEKEEDGEPEAATTTEKVKAKNDEPVVVYKSQEIVTNAIEQQP